MKSCARIDFCPQFHNQFLFFFFLTFHTYMNRKDSVRFIKNSLEGKMSIAGHNEYCNQFTKSCL